MFSSYKLRALAEYAVGLLTASLERTVLPPPIAERWQPFHRLLGTNAVPGRYLRPIYTDVGSAVAGLCMPLAPLTLTEEALFPRPKAQCAADGGWSDALHTVKNVAARAATVPDASACYAFERLYFSMQRFGANLAGTIDVESLSLFRQFALVSALFAASDGDTPAASYALVGSDTPGIQRFITGSHGSKGQAKGLRGRSFFLQLVSDAVARRVLDALALPRANLLYAAGGNLLLLAPASQDDRLADMRLAVSEALLEWSAGELDQALAWVLIPAGSVGRDVQPHLAALRVEINSAKMRPFADMLMGAAPAYDRLFAAEQIAAHGGAPNATGRQIEAEEGGDFTDLAEALRHGMARTLFLHRSRSPVSDRSPAWQRALHAISGGWHYGIKPSGDLDDSEVDVLVDAVNDPARVPSEATGFRFIGLTTPLRPDGSIRDFDNIAEVTPMSRIGVLRMDVDNLGAIFGHELRPATLAAICSLSSSLDLFFGGWLNVRVREVERRRDLSGVAPKERGALLYTIYSGGDDLFVVGAWDRLPVLAAAIQADFARYCANNPLLHLSSGIAIDSVRFPLYQLGARAAGALDEAKALRDKSGALSKNALSLFGRTVPWTSYSVVCDLVERLTATRVEPAALLGRLRDLAELDRIEREQYGLPPADVYGTDDALVGRAQWRGLVALVRAAEQLNGKNWSGSADDALAALLRDLGRLLLDGKLTAQLALAARWADYLWREPLRQEVN